MINKNINFKITINFVWLSFRDFLEFGRSESSNSIGVSSLFFELLVTGLPIQKKFYL